MVLSLYLQEEEHGIGCSYQRESEYFSSRDAIATYGAKDDELIPILSLLIVKSDTSLPRLWKNLSIQFKYSKKQAIFSGQFLRDAFHDTSGQACHYGSVNQPPAMS